MNGIRGLKRVLNRRDDDLANVDPLEFERIIAAWYERQGYRVEHTGTGGGARRFDGGIDLKLHRDGVCTLVQCKRHNAYQVTHNAVHELLGILETQGAQRGIVITTGEFTAYARESAAKSSRMELIDGEQLRALLGPIAVAGPSNIVSGRSGGFAQMASERLLAAAEDRIRYGGSGRRSGHRKRGLVAQVGIGMFIAKTVFTVVAFALIWWAFTSVMGNATKALAESQTRPRAMSTSAVPQGPSPAPVLTQAPGMQPPAQPAFHYPSPEEIAVSQRRADEAMRVLAPNTKELPSMPQRVAE